jgi:hypothetical protein
MKIELPGGHVLRVVAVFVGKGEANLDDLEQVHVTAHRLIVVVWRRLEAAYWTRDDTGELGVLDGSMGGVRLVRGGDRVFRAGGTYQSDERIIVYEIPYVPHFEVEIGRPYLPYGRHIAESFQLEEIQLSGGEANSAESEVRVRVGGVTYEPGHVHYLTRDANWLEAAARLRENT